MTWQWSTSRCFVCSWEIDMELSEQQMEAIMAGSRRNPWWTPVERPVGPQELPDWLIGAHVNLNERYASSPDVMLKVRRDPWPEGEEELYEDEGRGAWTARSSDGWCMVRHYHEDASRIFRSLAWRVVDSDEVATKAHCDSWRAESTAEEARERAVKYLELCLKLNGHKGHDYRIEYKEVWVTPKSGGYGGRHFAIKLKDGRELVLRGPWHGGPPVGWSECFVYDVSRERPWRPTPVMCKDGMIRKKHRPWHQQGGMFGYFFSEDLVLKAVARYEPTMLAAKVYPGYGRARLEFYPDEWGAPKMFAETRLPGWGKAKENHRAP